MKLKDYLKKFEGLDPDTEVASATEPGRFHTPPLPEIRRVVKYTHKGYNGYINAKESDADESIKVVVI